jgi:MFS family permease
MTATDAARPAAPAQAMIVPLALAQFIASYAATNMNVAVTTIAKAIGTTVVGMQATITLFTLTMAALMIPGSKLTVIWGRKVCFVAGLVIYGTGALLAALAQGLGLMIFGYSLLEGIGSALMIPPIYILVTVSFPDTRSRAKNFGIISGAAGLGAAMGPLLGGVITSGISWRASFGLQVLVVASIILLARRISDPRVSGPRPAFDLTGAILSAAGLFFIVLGILQSSTYGWSAARKNFTVGGTVVIAKGGVSPVWLFVAVGALILAWFFLHVRHREKKGKEPLIPLRMFASRTANAGLGTQLVQWLTMQGTFFVTSVFLQEVRKFDAIRTGLALTPAIVGLLVSSALAERFAKRHSQRWLIQMGFVITTAGMVLLLALVRAHSNILTLVPGLLLMGLGIGAMLTSSVNVVQSAFGEQDQGGISGLSRSVSNLGSSLGVALAGSILAATAAPGGKTYALSMIMLVVISLFGLAFAILIPRQKPVPAAPAA